MRLYHASFFLSVCAQASLFLTPEQKSKVISQSAFSQRRLEVKPSKMPLKLTGIFHRPDLDRWIVWINGKKIDSECPQSIQGWTVYSVGFDYVTLRSFKGEELVLYLEDQDKGGQNAKGASASSQSNEKANESQHSVKSNTGESSAQSQGLISDQEEKEKREAEEEKKKAKAKWKKYVREQIEKEEREAYEREQEKSERKQQWHSRSNNEIIRMESKQPSHKRPRDNFLDVPGEYLDSILEGEDFDEDDEDDDM